MSSIGHFYSSSAEFSSISAILGTCWWIACLSFVWDDIGLLEGALWELSWSLMPCKARESKPSSNSCDFFKPLYPFLWLCSSSALSSYITSRTTLSFFISAPLEDDGRLTTSSPLVRFSPRSVGLSESSYDGSSTLVLDLPLSFSLALLTFDLFMFWAIAVLIATSIS